MTANDLHNAAYKAYAAGEYKISIDLFRSALAANPSAGLELIIRNHLACAIWEGAGLESTGKVYSLTLDTCDAAEAAMNEWAAAVNIYHERVKNDGSELRRWPLKNATPIQVSKAAVEASTRAYAAISRVRRQADE